MAERTGDYQEEVLSDLLDLQAELRGETRDPAPAAAEPDAVVVLEEEAASGDEVLTVAASGVEVSVAPSGAAVTERLRALNDRLSVLEGSLARMTERIDVVETQPSPTDPDTGPDAPWRSFLDLQKIVAYRLDRR
ncbi:MAG TPA: hypothetical protein VFQ40_01825 [Actinomycetota bacterium]|nr:hypothetical protein [Actinomycetota bacterium]